MKSCKHQRIVRLATMDTITKHNLDYNVLPDRDFIHVCKACGNECSEFDLWQDMKELYD